MNGFGGITFQNIPAVSSPGGLVAAAEGLTIDPLNPGTVLFGGDYANPGYISDPFNGRIIKTEGGGIVIQSVYDDIFNVSVKPGDVKVFYRLGGSGIEYCRAEIDAVQGTLGMQTNAGFGNNYGPEFYLVNKQGSNQSEIHVHPFDSGGINPFMDGCVMVRVGGTAMKFASDGVPFVFSTKFNGANNPVPDLIIDDNGPSLVQLTGDKVAQSVVRIENTVAGNTEPVAEIVGSTAQLRLRSTDGTRTVIDFVTDTGAVAGALAWEGTGANYLRLTAPSDLRLAQGADRIRLTSNTIYHNANTRLGALTGTAMGRLHIAAQTAAANTAPIYLEANATLMTTPQNGAFEFDGTNLYFTVGGVRKIIQLI
jgi:hypothetical protein